MVNNKTLLWSTLFRWWFDFGNFSTRFLSKLNLYLNFATTGCGWALPTHRQPSGVGDVFFSVFIFCFSRNRNFFIPKRRIFSSPKIVCYTELKVDYSIFDKRGIRVVPYSGPLPYNCPIDLYALVMHLDVILLRKARTWFVTAVREIRKFTDT